MKLINLLEGYHFVQSFSSNKNITLSLLKSLPHVKVWHGSYLEKNDRDEFVASRIEPIWESFVDAIKEKLYPIRNYDASYMRWKILCKERDQMVPEYINIFLKLCLKIGIRDFEWKLVVK